MERLIKIPNKILAISDQGCMKKTIAHVQVKLVKGDKGILIYPIKRLNRDPSPQLKKMPITRHRNKNKAKTSFLLASWLGSKKPIL